MPSSSCASFCEVLFAILLPPLGVCLRYGCCGVEFWICLLLTVLGYIPGIIYALYAILFMEPHGAHASMAERHQPLNA